jgi:hypothetical protein
VSAIDRGLADIFLAQGPGQNLYPIIGGHVYAFNTTTAANTVQVGSVTYTNLPFLGSRATAFANGSQNTQVLLIVTAGGPLILGKIDFA